MERSVNAERLRGMLGGRERELTPEAFADLIRQVETQLLQVGDLDRAVEVQVERLENMGWYLFGLATHPRPAERYLAGMRREAFQVVSHVFDLTLKFLKRKRGIHWQEDAALIFALQVACLRGDIHPNAVAVLDRYLPNHTFEGLEFFRDHHHVPLVVGMLFLAQKLDRLKILTDDLANHLKRHHRDDLEIPFENTIFGVAFQAVRGVSAATTFLESGNLQQLEFARESLRQAAVNPEVQGDVPSKWVVWHLWQLMTDLRNASPWTVFPPGTPPGTVQAFTQGKSPILTLWPPQVEFLAGEHHRLFQDTNKYSLLASPTSAGKTLMAQLVIAHHLSSREGDVCVVVPTRSLSREVTRKLRERFRPIPQALQVVETDAIGLDLENAEQATRTVLVVTPEKLGYLLRMNPQSILDRFKLFVFDEIHNVGNEQRGFRLEGVLSYLLARTEDTDHRFMLMSASISNKTHFLNWLSTDGTLNQVRHNVQAVHANWRGPRRRTGIYTTRPVRREAIIEDERTWWQVTYQGDQRLCWSDGNQTSVVLPDAPGTLWFQDRECRNLKTGQVKRQLLLPCILHSITDGFTLVVEENTGNTQTMARILAEELPSIQPVPQKLQNLIEHIARYLGQQHAMVKVLRKGVGFHHGRLPMAVRNQLEDAVHQGLLKCLVCTTTLTEGINFPAKSVVVVVQDRNDTHLKGSALLNAMGRAGRAVMETEGSVTVAYMQGFQPDMLNTFNVQEDQIISRLAEQANAFMEFDERLRNNMDLIYQVDVETEPDVAHFVSFIWFLFADLEAQHGAEQLEAIWAEQITHLLMRTLMHQQNPHLMVFLFSIAGQMFEVYKEENPTRRQRWAKSSTSLGTTRGVDQVAQELYTDIHEILAVHLELNDQDLLLRLLRQHLGRLISLPDVKSNTVDYEITHFDLLEAWLDGHSPLALLEIARQDRASTNINKVHLYINHLYEYALPWVVSTTLEQLAQRLQTEGKHSEEELGLVQRLRQLPALIRYGVPEVFLVRVLQRHTIRREILCEVYRAAGEKSEEGLREHLNTLPVVLWKNRFQATNTDGMQLLEFCETIQSRRLVESVTQVSHVLMELNQATRCTPGPCEVRVQNRDTFPHVEVHQAGQLVGHLQAKYVLPLMEFWDEFIFPDFHLENHDGEWLLKMEAAG